MFENDIIGCPKAGEKGRRPTTLRLLRVSEVSVFAMIIACTLKPCIPRFSLYDCVVCQKARFLPFFCGAEAMCGKTMHSKVVALCLCCLSEVSVLTMFSRAEAMFVKTMHSQVSTL